MNVLVAGGGTVAPIDDVRTITNSSSGRFAAAITESCLMRGARVWHIHAKTAQLPFVRLASFNLDCPDDAAEIERVRRLHETWNRVKDRLTLLPLAKGTVSDYAQTLRQVLIDRAIDVVFLPMAVSDYEPIPEQGKLRSGAEELVVHCRRTPKIIQLVRDWAPNVYLVGFKLLSRVEPPELIARAEASGVTNRADLTVANEMQAIRAGQHSVYLVRSGCPAIHLEPGPDLADRLVDHTFRWAAKKSL